MSESYELELYKLIMMPDEQYNYVQEFGWINDEKFCVWVSYWWVKEFMDGLTDIFGYEIFDDGAFDGNMQDDCICITLNETLEGYDIDFESIFPKDKFAH